MAAARLALEPLLLELFDFEPEREPPYLVAIKTPLTVSRAPPRSRALWPDYPTIRYPSLRCAYHLRLPVARHFLTGEELTREQLNALLDRAAELKAGRAAGEGRDTLAGRSIALVFERPSTRTRV